MAPKATAHSVLSEAREMIRARDKIILEQHSRIRELEAAIVAMNVERRELSEHP